MEVNVRYSALVTLLSTVILSVFGIREREHQFNLSIYTQSRLHRLTWSVLGESQKPIRQEAWTIVTVIKVELQREGIYIKVIFELKVWMRFDYLTAPVVFVRRWSGRSLEVLTPRRNHTTGCPTCIFKTVSFPIILILCLPIFSLSSNICGHV